VYWIRKLITKTPEGLNKNDWCYTASIYLFDKCYCYVFLVYFYFFVIV
jgi:hypothetical protein